MPAATTHVEFARDVFNHLSLEQQKGITDKSMYFLGSQGPDYFFFSRFMFLPGSLNKYGNLMHDEKVEEAIMFMDHYSEDIPALRSYFYGFLTHYSLDSTAHPLICSFADREHQETGVPVSEAHFREEGEIDVYVLGRCGRSAKQYNVYSDLHISKENAKLLAQMYHQLFLSVYEQDVPEKQIYKTAAEVHFITKALSPSAAKFKLVYQAEKLAKIPHLISGMMLENKNTDPAVLNLAHNEWRVPGYGTLTSRASFPELYDEAMAKAKHLIKERTHSDFDRTFVGLPI